VKAELHIRKRSLLWDFISVKAGEGRVRKEKFGFVSVLLSLLGDSSFEVQSHMKAVKAES
jgi:hypothetical protein